MCQVETIHNYIYVSCDEEENQLWFEIRAMKIARKPEMIGPIRNVYIINACRERDLFQNWLPVCSLQNQSRQDAILSYVDLDRKRQLYFANNSLHLSTD